jgi:two-component system, OmpR family, response regulator
VLRWHVMCPCLYAVPSSSDDFVAAPGQGRPSPADIAGLRVIVAEDDPMMRDLIACALRSDGFDVLEAASGDALERLASAIARGTLEVSLVVSDIRLPGQSGLRCCR